MTERLLVVEEAFVARGKGVLLMPRFTMTSPSPPKGAIPVRLRLPNGTEKTTTALVEVAHMRGALAPYAMYRLPELSPEDVPPGTELWSAT